MALSRLTRRRAATSATDPTLDILSVEVGSPGNLRKCAMLPWAVGSLAQEV
jgi:hypothetical protein